MDSINTGSLADVRGLRLVLQRHPDRPGFEFTPTIRDEKALICAAIYRRDGGWRLRAVGQGYADGLAGIARDFGVDVA